MHYESFAPTDSLKHLVKEYWIFENEDPSIHTQKIIPDGYSEIIIHYGDPYRINLTGNWETQSSMLFSNQISRFFFLENTGKSGMLGIKLFPTAFSQLFQKDVAICTDQVIALDQVIGTEISGLQDVVNASTIEAKVKAAEDWISSKLQSLIAQPKIDECISLIFNSNGMIDMEELARRIQLSTRQMERLFKKVVGLTPKFYCRIIRFNYIFEVMKDQNESWIRTALQSGYFDQSHFIKNFKEFTGEEPSSYGFNEVNLANFFLKK